MNYFTISELLRSPIAIERRLWNGANLEKETNMMALIDHVLDPARQRYGRRVLVSSGYRCPELNRLVGGALHSQHMMGEAADIYTDEGREGNLELARIIVSLGNFDQLILENVSNNDLRPQWLHVSWRRNGNNRRVILKKVSGQSGYMTLNASELLSF